MKEKKEVKKDRKEGKKEREKRKKGEKLRKGKGLKKELLSKGKKESEDETSEWAVRRGREKER